MKSSPQTASQSVQDSNYNLRFQKFHTYSGITLLSAGVILLLLDTMTFVVRDKHYMSGVGIWMSFIYILPGCFITLAAFRRSKRFICVGVVLDILGFFVGIIGTACAVIEYITRKDEEAEPAVQFLKYKALLDIIIIVVLSCLLLVHSCFGCQTWRSPLKKKPRQYRSTLDQVSSPQNTAPIHIVAPGNNQQYSQPQQQQQQQQYQSSFLAQLKDDPVKYEEPDNGFGGSQTLGEIATGGRFPPNPYTGHGKEIFTMAEVTEVSASRSNLETSVMSRPSPP